MSEPSGEKTEAPTDKKIRDARNKGQVAKSTDVSSTWMLVTMFCYLAMSKNVIIGQLYDMLTLPTHFYAVPFKDALAQVYPGVMQVFMVMILPLLGFVTVMALFINFVQVGPLLTFEPLKPDLNKMNPVQGMKKIFAKKNLIEFLKSSIKMVFLGYLIYRVVKAVINPLLMIPFAGIAGIFEVLNPILKMFAINVSAGYTIIAVIDLFFQRSQHFDELKMTKDEVKREFKEMEGDPLIKGERKQLHQEMAMNDTIESTKKASALVTNPEHFAVAIFYNEDAVKLPVVTAKGKDHIARLMIKAAQEADIPIMRDVNLARTLYSDVEAWNYVPSDLIGPVAAVLKWAKELYEGKNPELPSSFLAEPGQEPPAQ